MISKIVESLIKDQGINGGGGTFGVAPNYEKLIEEINGGIINGI